VCPCAGRLGRARDRGLSLATPALRSDRLTLDPLRVEDAAEMVEILASPELHRFTAGMPPSLDELRRRYRLQVAGGSPDGREVWHNWVLRTHQPVEAIGYVQATVRDGGLTADVGWVVASRWQGRGYAAEAAGTMVAWLNGSGVEVVTAHIHPDHARSARVAERAGLRPTAVIEDGERVWRREIVRDPDRRRRRRARA